MNDTKEILLAFAFPASAALGWIIGELIKIRRELRKLNAQTPTTTTKE